jgi:acyl carrier protein
MAVDQVTLPLLSLDAFVSHVVAKTIGELPGPQAPVQLDASLPDLGFDSFLLLELLGAIDELGVMLDEDIFVRVDTLRDLYHEYVEVAAADQVPTE